MNTVPTAHCALKNQKHPEMPIHCDTIGNEAITTTLRSDKRKVREDSAVDRICVGKSSLTIVIGIGPSPKE